MQTMSKVYDTVPNDPRSDEGSDSSDVENVSQAMDYRLDSSLSLAMPVPGSMAPHNFLSVKQESDDSCDGGEGMSPISSNKFESHEDDMSTQQYDKKGNTCKISKISNTSLSVLN